MKFNEEQRKQLANATIAIRKEVLRQVGLENIEQFGTRSDATFDIEKVKLATVVLLEANMMFLSEILLGHSDQQKSMVINLFNKDAVSRFWFYCRGLEEIQKGSGVCGCGQKH